MFSGVIHRFESNLAKRAACASAQPNTARRFPVTGTSTIAHQLARPVTAIRVTASLDRHAYFTATFAYPLDQAAEC